MGSSERQVSAWRWMLVCLGLALVAAALPLAQGDPARGDDGDLDLAYGDGGVALVDAALGDEEARALSLMPNGEVIVAGAHTRHGADNTSGREPAYVRFSPDGTVVPTSPDWENGGRRYDLPMASAPAPGGTLVVAVGSDRSTGPIGVLRYLASGALDRQFGGDGFAFLTIRNGAVLSGNALAVAVAPDGAVIVAGRTEDAAGASSLVVGRFRPDGAVDVGFGEGGAAQLELADQDGVPVDTLGQSLALLPDGRIVVAGTLIDDFGPLELLARYTPAGQPDPSFNRGAGFTVGPLSPDWGEIANSLAVHADGRATVAGMRVGDQGADVFLRRHLADGRVDTTFAGGTVVVGDPQVDEIVTGLAVDGAGRMVVTGGAVHQDADADVLLARYLSDGRPDPGFRGGGLTHVDLGGDDFAVGVAVDGGRIVVAATSADAEGGDIALLRFTEEGRPDASLGGTGRMLADFPSGADHRSGMAVATDGSVITVGGANLPAPIGLRGEGIVVRQRPDGRADTGFRRRGVAFTSRGDRTDDLRDVALLSDGSAVVVGGTTPLGSRSERLVLRLHPDGSPDGAFGDGGEAVGARLPDENYAAPYDAVAVTGDDRIVAVAVQEYENRVVVARYLPDGRLDPAFGNGGLAWIDINYVRSPWDIAATPDGGMVLTGQGAIGNGSQWAVLRLTATGGRDHGFSGESIPLQPPGGDPMRILSLATGPDGTVLVAGTRPSPTDENATEVAVARLAGDGRPDPHFDCDGYAVASFPGAGRPVTVSGVVVGADGRVVVGGAYSEGEDTLSAPPKPGGVFAMRWLADGSRDTSLSGDGTAISALEGGRVKAAGVGLAGNSPVLAGAMTNRQNGDRVDGFSVRFAAGGTPPAPEPATDRLVRCVGAALSAGDAQGVVAAAEVAVEPLLPTLPVPVPPVPALPAPPAAPLPLRVTGGTALTGRPPAPTRPEAAVAWWSAAHS